MQLRNSPTRPREALPSLICAFPDRDRLYLVGRDGRLTYAGGRGPMGFEPDELEAAIRVELGKARREYF